MAVVLFGLLGSCALSSRAFCAAPLSPTDTVSVADLPTRWLAGAPVVAIGNPTDIVIAPDGQRAYLINAGGCTVEVLDLKTGTLIGAPIVVGLEPSALAITPDARIACVANNRDFSVSIIDLKTNSVIGRPIVLRGFIDASGATDVAITPDGGRALVVVAQEPFVYMLDLAKHRVSSRIRLPRCCSELIKVTPDGARAVVATVGHNAVWVVDLNSHRVLGAPVLLNDDPDAMALSSDGKLAYLLSGRPGENALSIIDVATCSLLGTPISVYAGNCDCPNRFIAITPDGKRAYLVNGGNMHAPLPAAAVRMVDLVQGRLMRAPVEAGDSPSSLGLTADGARAYVLSSGAGTISTVDLATNQLVGAPIEVASHMSVARRRLLAADQLRHLEATADSVFGKVPLPAGPKWLAGVNRPLAKVMSFAEDRRGGVAAEYIIAHLKDLREEVEQPCPLCETSPSQFNIELTNEVLDLRWRLNKLMDDGFPPDEAQPMVDVLTAVAIELGFW